MCTKIKIFLGKKKLIFAVLFPFLLSDDGSVSVNFEKSTVQHSLGWSSNFALLIGQVLISSRVFLVGCYKRGKKCVGSIWILLWFLGFSSFIKSPKKSAVGFFWLSSVFLRWRWWRGRRETLCCCCCLTFRMDCVCSQGCVVVVVDTTVAWDTHWWCEVDDAWMDGLKIFLVVLRQANNTLADWQWGMLSV